MKDWVIKMLGGITKEDHETERLKHERWAIENLTGKNGEVTPDCMVYLPFDGDDIVITRSQIRVANARVARIKIAPWCRHVMIEAITT